MHLLPAAPSGVTAVATSPTTILITWTDNSGNEDGFHVAKNGFFPPKSAGPNATSYVWTGLTPGTEGCFRVRAYNSYGTSSLSPLACATTPSS
jgi:titin